ncbi:MAG TPA: Wzz/FepE/Etk N-terminal domain-containing protein [candidate division Zixibacteria bacterium]|nr:Wzz/FepE/Etk N-terminal domain-containing protein [candidate division Zixibacteria bacterium]
MSQEGTTNLWRLLEVLARRKRFILTTVIVVTLAALAVSLVLPKYYKARSLLLPPKDTSLPVAGLSLLSDVVSVTKGLNLPVMVTTSDVYARMLSSRRIIEPVIANCLSYEQLDARNADEAIKNFLDNSGYEVTEEGLLEITYEDRDPELAARVVNALVEQLDKVNREIATSRARENRSFIEERLDQVRRELDSSRAALEQFQNRYKTVDFDEQIRLATEQAIQLKIRLAETELSLQMMSDKYGPDNTDLKDLKRRREVLLGQIEQLETSNADSSFFSLPIADVPALRGEFEKLYSRVKVNEGLYQTLLSQHEQAKIQENEELPTITILDRAEAPRVKSWPKRAYIVLAAFAVSLVVSILLAAFFEYLTALSVSHPDDYRRAVIFLAAFFGWLPSVKRMKQSLP